MGEKVVEFEDGEVLSVGGISGNLGILWVWKGMNEQSTEGRKWMEGTTMSSD
jgi:hypothetical protein